MRNDRGMGAIEKGVGLIVVDLSADTLLAAISDGSYTTRSPEREERQKFRAEELIAKMTAISRVSDASAAANVFQ